MGLEIDLNGQELNVPDVKIKYSKQVADIFDLAAVTSSVTNTFTFPKTPNNTQVMRQLGLVGDTSRMPYEKVITNVKDGGFPVITNGWLNVTETATEYRASVADGMIDFFKAIDNKTMGTDLDLSQFSHEKNLETVIASFTGEYYKYIIADYNGKNFADSEDGVGINIDYLVPSFNVGKLLELVFTTMGYTFDTTNIEELDEFYVTYPKNPAENIVEDLIAKLDKGLWVAAPVNIGNGICHFPAQHFWDGSDITEGSLLNNWRYVIPTDGAYHITADVEAYAHYKQYNYNPSTNSWSFGGLDKYNPMTVNITVNSDTITSFQTDPYEVKSGEAFYYFSAGDIIEIQYLAPLKDGAYLRLLDGHHNSSDVRILKTNQGNVILNEVFKDFQIKDFFKECLWRTATIPIIDPVAKHIYFLSIAEYLDFGRADDWTDFYAGRVKETYVQGSYAQKNIFRHKYNDQDDTSQDGYLYVNNQNLAADKQLLQSKIYAPENVITAFTDINDEKPFETRKYTVWARESKEDADGIVSVGYKGLTGRFYFIKAALSIESTWRMVSEAIVGSQTVSQIPYADIQGTTFAQIVADKYNTYNGVLDNFRCHEIGLAMGIADFIGADLTRPKYFEQEGQYYILNRLNYETGKIISGEFVRINKVPEYTLAGKTIVISISALGSAYLKVIIPIDLGYDTLDTGDTEFMVNGDPYPLVAITTSDTQITGYLSTLGETPISIESFTVRVGNGTDQYDYIFDGLPTIFTDSDIAAHITQSFITYKAPV